MLPWHEPFRQAERPAIWDGTPCVTEEAKQSSVLTMSLPLIDVVHSHSVTRLSLTGPRASLLRTSSG